MASGLDYAIHRVIRSYNDNGENRLGIVKTYKTVFDVYNRLKEAPDSYDLCLPWSWFIHGPVIQTGLLSPDTIQVELPEGRSDGEDFFRRVTTRNLDTSRVPKPVRERIDVQVEKSVKDFLEMNAREVTNVIYDRYAPHPFEITLRKLVRGFDDRDLDYDDRDVRLIDLAQRQFPYDEFADLTAAFVDWSAMMRLAVERYPKYLWDTPAIVKEFQRLYGFRMSLKFNEHVAPLVPEWHGEYVSLRPRMIANISESRRELSKLVQPRDSDILSAYRDAFADELEERVGAG